MAPRGRDFWLYSILYHMSRILGALPVSRNSHVTLALHPCGPELDCFSPSPYGIVIILLQAAPCSLLAYQSHLPFPTNTLESALFCLLIINWGSAFISMLLSLISAREVAHCLSTSCKNHTSSTHHLYRIPFLMFFILLLYPFFTFFQSCPCLEYHEWLMYNYAHAPVAAVEVAINTMCFISERSFSDINSQLRVYHEDSVSVTMFPALLYYLECHLNVSKSVASIARTFSPHFLNIFLSFTLRAICYAVIFVGTSRAGMHADLKVTIYQCSYLIFRLFFMCYRCQKVKEEAAETSIIVRRLRVQWMEELSEHQSELLSTYKELLDAPSVNFTACGFFPVSMLQALNMLGVITTYGLVAMQGGVLDVQILVKD